MSDFTVDRDTTKRVLGANGTLVEYAIDEPAFEFNTDGTYKGLLVEPAATNICLQSESLNSATWTKSAGGTGSVPIVTQDDAIAPDGTTTAELVAFDRGAGDTINDRSYLQQSNMTVVDDSTYTASVWMKAATSGDVGKEIAFRTVGGVAYGVITLTADWTRYERTETSVGTNGTISIESRGTVSDDNTVSAYIWGAQVEAGPIATSYIPTDASQATRNKDDIYLTGASSLIGQAAGTLYVEVDFNYIAGIDQFILSANDNTVNNRVLIALYSNNNIAGQLRAVDDTTQLSVSTSGSSFTGIKKIAFAYASNDGVMYVNGSSVGTPDTSGNTFSAGTLTNVDLGQNVSASSQANMHIRAVALFDSRLSNTDLATLTTI